MKVSRQEAEENRTRVVLKAGELFREHGFEPGGVAGGQVDSGFGDAEGLGEKDDHGGVGLALVGDGGDAEAEDCRAVGEGFVALDDVTPGIGRDAEPQDGSHRLNRGRADAAGRWR